MVILCNNIQLCKGLPNNVDVFDKWKKSDMKDCLQNNFTYVSFLNTNYSGRNDCCLKRASGLLSETYAQILSETWRSDTMGDTRSDTFLRLKVIVQYKILIAVKKHITNNTIMVILCTLNEFHYI